MKSICLIPARNSSTRLKNKNISPFGNGNLITHTIDQALEAFCFDRIVLSSNDLMILDIAKNYHIETHFRDDSEDQLLGVIRQAIPSLGVEDDDVLTLLLVTCPLRESWEITEAFKRFVIDEDCRHTLVSVKKNENPIQMAFEIDEGGHLEPVFPEEFLKSTRKQDQKDTYFFNDAFIIDTVKNWMNESRPNLYGDPIPYLMPWERSIAIDYEFQLNIARSLWRNL